MYAIPPFPQSARRPDSLPLRREACMDLSTAYTCRTVTFYRDLACAVTVL